MDRDSENNDSQDIKDLISRFEELVESGSGIYFDVDELEDIIDYYDMNRDVKLLDKALEAAKQIYPNHSYFKLKSAQRFSSLGENNKAVRILRKILLSEPDNLMALESLAYIYSQEGKQLKAIETFLEMIDKGAEEADIWLNIALEYETLEKYEMALSYLNKILDKYPEFDSALYEALFCYESVENMEGSIEFFKKFTDQQPYSSAAWFNLGISYSNLARFEEAIDAYDFVLAIDPSYSSASFNKGNAFMNLGNFEKAVQSFKETFDQEPEDSLTHLYIAKSYENLELWDDAIRHYFRAIELNEKQSEAWAGIGLIYHQLDLPHKALGFLEEAIIIEPNNEEYNMALAALMIDMEKYPEAEKILIKLIEDGNLEPDTWFFLTDVKIILDKLDSAFELLSNAPDEIKNHKKIIFKTADLLIQMKMLKEAQLYLNILNITDIIQFNSLMENPETLDFFLNGSSES